jgi:hypothetical protein
MKRVILRAELSPQAKHGLERVCDQRGMTQVSVMSRLVLWFSKQDPAIQKAVLGESELNAADALKKELLQRLARR